MPITPPTQNDIYTDIRERVLESDADITNWSPQSPEKALTDEGFASLLAVLWHATLAAQLSGWIAYAGGPITAADLDDLGLAPESESGSVDLELLNSMLRDEDLDAKAAQNSVTRDPGVFATGELEITTTSDSVVVDEGVRVTTGGTEPLAFETTEEVTPAAGSTTATAPIEAVERGSEYNVGSDTITVMPSPPQGVRGVTNPVATTGGEDRETNAEFRQRAKQAIVQNSGGGTTGGIEGGLAAAFDGVTTDDVIVDEFGDASPVYADVIVDGGPSDAEVQAKINELRPTAITHNLVRPTQITIDVSADVTGSGVDASTLESALTEYVGSLGIGEGVVRDSLIATLMTEEPGVTGIDSLTISDSSGEVTDDRAIGPREKAIPGAVSVTVV
jgi:uncharacterized phage protein gp47/JayE